MKLTYLIIITMLLGSCGYRSIDFQKQVVITKVGTSIYGGNKCYYEGIGTNTSSIFPLLDDANFCFYDDCGKYNIGDTLKIVKQ